MDAPETIGTQTQDKKNRKKRACLGRTIHNSKKKLKVTNSSLDMYNTYITYRCLKPAKKNEKRPPFVDFGGYHISYDDFQQAMKPRGFVDTYTIELYIRHFNLAQSLEPTNSPLPTKYAFSQSLTSKLIVPEHQFHPSTLVREFNAAYHEGSLKYKDLLFFAIPYKEHWVLCCINLLYKQINIFDSNKKMNKDEAYEMANNLVYNFITLTNFVKVFTKLKFNQFTCHNPDECPQQGMVFDCGVFTMLFMMHWDEKKIFDFPKDMYAHRAHITEMILTSQLNKQDHTWVLQKK